MTSLAAALVVIAVCTVAGVALMGALAGIGLLLFGPRDDDPTAADPHVWSDEDDHAVAQYLTHP